MLNLHGLGQLVIRVGCGAVTVVLNLTAGTHLHMKCYATFINQVAQTASSALVLDHFRVVATYIGPARLLPERDSKLA